MEQIKQGAKKGDAVGLMDWDKATGISSDLYKQETFESIEQRQDQRGARLLDVTVRAGIMYKRELSKA